MLPTDMHLGASTSAVSWHSPDDVGAITLVGTATGEARGDVGEEGRGALTGEPPEEGWFVSHDVPARYERIVLLDDGPNPSEPLDIDASMM